MVSRAHVFRTIDDCLAAQRGLSSLLETLGPRPNSHWTPGIALRPQYARRGSPNGVSSLLSRRVVYPAWNGVYALLMTDRGQPRRSVSWPWTEWWPWAIALVFVSAVATFALSIASQGCNASTVDGTSLCRDFYLIPPDIRPGFMPVVAMLAAYLAYRLIRSVQRSKTKTAL